jgi:hypothetical protein
VADWANRVDTLPGTYTRVVQPMEFHDSLLIVPDMGEKLVWRINVRAGSREPFGSQGGGPGEYERVGWAGQVHQDSVIIFQGFGLAPMPVIDVVSGRGRTHTAAAGRDDGGVDAIMLSVSEPMFRFSDTTGALYGSPTLAQPTRDSASGRMLPPFGPPDTTPVVRYRMRRGDVDTLTRYVTGGEKQERSLELIRRNVRPMGLGVYGAHNDWHVMRGGELVVVDAATYVVRVQPADGADTREFTLSWTPISVSDSGWQAHVQATTKGSTVLFEKSMKDISAQMGKAMGGAAPSYIVPDKPRFLPAVSLDGGTRRMYSADRIVWIPVHRAEPPRNQYWDLVDVDRGERITTLVFPPNHRLLHVSSLGAYVAAIDDDDLERILLYRR